MNQSRFSIVPDIFGGLPSSDVAKPPHSSGGELFGLEEQIPDEQCPQSLKR
jgi:hypothetical protein